MIEIENILVSEEIIEQQFVCDLNKCKGACCVEGDLGAPLTEPELKQIQESYPVVRPYLSGEGIAAIEEQGVYVLDWEGDYSTPTIGNRECAYAIYDDQKILKCGIEQAYNDGKTDFKKPISCHLYPIRTIKLHEGEAINYDKWPICADACTLGNHLKVPVYKFVKDALIRKYGEVWYEKLTIAVEDLQK